MYVRKNVPESPRWLFIHGYEDHAEQTVGRIEDEVREESGERLLEADEELTVRQRRSIPFREIAKVAFKTYTKRSVLCIALFVGQAFMYNGITFDLGTLLTTFYDRASGTVPYLIAIWAASNFLGPLILGRFFDSVGRKPMISMCYLGSAALGLILGFVMLGGSESVWLFMGLLVATFFLASSGASAAYLTVSEIFPMETRALAIAFFYAIGTAAGGIAGPLLFGRMIESEDRSLVALALCIGAGVMALGGVAELLFGVKAERADLEAIAKPLTAEDAEDQAPDREEPVGREPEGASATGRTPRPGSRLRPGPGSAGVYAPWPSVSSRDVPPEVSAKEVQGIIDYVRDLQPVGDVELHRAIGARRWGPGRFRSAVREAIRQGHIRRTRRGRLETT